MDFYRVMIVEDELPAREQLRTFAWEDYGCRLAGEAENGEEALRLIETVRPQIIVTDVMMPTLDGLSLIKALQPRFPSLPIILLTCYGDYPYVREALRLGAIDYLLKGLYREEELGSALVKAIDKLDASPLRQSALAGSAEAGTGAAEAASSSPEGERELRYEVAQAIALAGERLHENISAVDIAEAVGLSPKYFGSLFRKQTGEVFQDYVKRVRMEKAALLLRTTGLKVYEVADRVGYPNYRYFTEVFSKHFGKTPREVKGAGR